MSEVAHRNLAAQKHLASARDAELKFFFAAGTND